MDGKRFDDLARAIGAGISRRRLVLGGLGIAGVSIAGGNAATGAARCKVGGRVCTRNGQCCSSACQRITGNATRARYVCGCTDGKTLCGSRCVDLASDRGNCGGCGKRCSAASTCVAGSCYVAPTPTSTPIPTSTPTPPCPAGEKWCGSACVELGTDTNCTDCGVICSSDSSLGPARQFCNDTSGCQTACQAVGTGFVSTDWPPQVFGLPEVDNTSVFWYKSPQIGSLDAVDPCTTSADCEANCPDMIMNGSKPVVGCACLNVRCDDGNQSFSFINRFGELAADTAFCSVMYKD